jgi:hypothetical protein
VAGVRVFVRLDELNSARPDSVVASGATSVVSIVVPRLLLTATTFDGLPLVVQTLATGLKAPRREDPRLAAWKDPLIAGASAERRGTDE